MSGNREIFKPIASEHLVNNGLKMNYPNGKKFAVCLTHDVDAVYLDKYTILKQLMHNVVFPDPGIFMHKLPSLFSKKRDDLWNFSYMMDIEKRYGAKSTFFIMSLQKGEPDHRYDPMEVKAEIRRLVDEGWDVGLHGGHEAFNDVRIMKKEKARLESVAGVEITGYRNHYLRFEIPTTWNALRDSGFLYDSTYGFDDCVGFRNGMCHPFRPYDLRSDSEIDILEIPPIVMDCALWGSMKLHNDVSWTIVKGLIDKVEENCGVFTLIWHNNYVYGEDLKLYTKILDLLKEKDAWITSAGEISKRWQDICQEE